MAQDRALKYHEHAGASPPAKSRLIIIAGLRIVAKSIFG
jgi:hypothetical protein